MSKITDKIAALPPDGHFFSLEFFPPKTEAGQNNLQARLSRMARALRPAFVNVTWGAGGSTAGRSLELAELCQTQLGLTTCLHLTCTNLAGEAGGRALLDRTLRAARDLGVRNILALRGDPPRRHEYGLDNNDGHGPGVGGGSNGVDRQVTTTAGGAGGAGGVGSNGTGVTAMEDGSLEETKFEWAADLVRYIREMHGDYFCIGVAGYPEGHADESNWAGKGSQSVEFDLPYLVEKVKAGADFIMTQLFYDVDAYTSYEKRVREYDADVLGKIPIIPGLMPIQSFSGLQRITNLSHASLPEKLVRRLEPHRNNDQEIKRIGVDVLTEIVEKLKRVPSPTPRGFHFYTLNLEKSVSYIVERCRLIPELTPADFLDEGDDDDAVADRHEEAVANGHIDVPPRRPRSRRPSSPYNHTMDDGSVVSSSPESRATTLAITHGVGTLGREATWDEFTNGRFGDSRSPAFGEIDGYGPSIHMSPASARMRWGSPTSMADIQALFTAHIRGRLDMLPWSEGAVNAETRVIEKQLCGLIERGWLSIASQPAVDAADSGDPIFGWGPPAGFVFQKAFVEMFVPRKDWETRLRPRLQRAKEEGGKVSWYASPCSLPVCRGVPARNDGSDVNVSPEFESSDSGGGANSVTWGAFPGKEIATSTIIEETSFKAWVEEAFNLWAEWERCYPAGPNRSFLRRCREDMWLVNVVGHSFKDQDELWGILLGA